MPRINNLRNLHLGEARAAAGDTTPQSPASAGAERWYGIQQQNSLLTSLDTYGMAAATANGTATTFQDSTGSYINYASSTALNSVAGWHNTATNIVQTRLLPDLTVVMKTGAAASDIANLRIWVGLQSGGSALATDTPGASAVSSLMFLYSTPRGDTTWFAQSSDADSDASTNTGVSVAADTRYVMRIRVVSTSSVEYYINGTLVATLSAAAHLPADSTGLRTGAHTVNALAGTARNIRLRKFYVEAN